MSCHFYRVVVLGSRAFICHFSHFQPSFLSGQEIYLSVCKIRWFVIIIIIIIIIIIRCGSFVFCRFSIAPSFHKARERREGERRQLGNGDGLLCFLGQRGQRQSGLDCLSLVGTSAMTARDGRRAGCDGSVAGCEYEGHSFILTFSVSCSPRKSCLTHVLATGTSTASSHTPCTRSGVESECLGFGHCTFPFVVFLLVSNAFDDVRWWWATAGSATYRRGAGPGQTCKQVMTMG